MDAIKTAGVVGAGLTGAGWAARFLAHGLDVIAADPGPGAEDRLGAGVDRAWPALEKLGLMPGAGRDRLRFTDDLEQVAAEAQFIQESVTEQAALESGLHRALDRAAPMEVVIASSGSTQPTRLQAHCRHPGRIVVGHPCDPVYLLPLVEVWGGDLTLPASIEAAAAFYRWVGMRPVLVRNPIVDHLSDRLRSAVWEEARRLAEEGGVTPEDMDAVITHGPGLVWAVLGAAVAPAAEDAALDRLRDECLIGIMRTLRQYDQASGQVIAALEQKRYTRHRHRRWSPEDEIGRPLELYDGAVDPGWIDYNGHMTESSYLAAFGDASDALFRYAGIDEAYRAAGHSFYTVETHLNYYREVGSGEPLHFTTQVLGLDEKRLHLFHTLSHGLTRELLATTEQMLVHVDTRLASAAPIQPGPAAALQAVWAAHQAMPIPGQVGRQMAIRRKT